MASSLSQFRARFPEFTSIADSVITLALSDAAAIMDVSRWGDRFDTGQEFLAAHYVASSSTVGGDAKSGRSAWPLQQGTTGPLSSSFAVPAAKNSTDAMYMSTRYGQRYLELRRIVGRGALVV